VSNIDPPTARVFHAQGLELNAWEWVNEGAPKLLLLHGWRDHGRSWDRVARALRNDFHILAPDLRGHGDSARSPDADYSMTAYLADVAELLDQAGFTELSLIGHSMGGNLAVRYSAIFPERIRRLVAIEGLRRPPPENAPAIDRRLRTYIEDRRTWGRRTSRRYPSLAKAQAALQATNPRLGSEQAGELTFHGMRRNEDGSYSWKFDDLARVPSPVDMSDEELQFLYGRIPCPVLLAYGANSWATSPAEDGRLALFQNARVALFEDAGHWLHHEQFRRFIEEVRPFLTG
jgi:pimeloyl-ACP methyl ester carboxylesterase